MFSRHLLSNIKISFVYECVLPVSCTSIHETQSRGRPRLLMLDTFLRLERGSLVRFSGRGILAVPPVSHPMEGKGWRRCVARSGSTPANVAGGCAERKRFNDAVQPRTRVR